MPIQFSPKAWLSLLDQQITAYPLAQVEDLYKFIFQAIRGPEHLIHNPNTFLARLEAEYDASEADPAQLLWETLRPDGQLGRVHLAAYRAHNLPLDALGTACLASAQQAWGGRAELQALWHEVELEGLGLHWLSLKPGEFQRFGGWIESQGFGAIHHSQRYRAAYRPAYRLVSLQAWQNIK